MARRGRVAACVVAVPRLDNSAIRFEHRGGTSNASHEEIVNALAHRSSVIPFGEFLVEEQVLDRFQLFCALQLQDRRPGVRLGECVAALGYAPINAIERLYERFARFGVR